MELWVASALFYVYVYGLCAFVRLLLKMSQKHMSRLDDRLVTALSEVIGTVQVCAPMFDVDFVCEHYGLMGVFLEITALEFANWYTMGNAWANPCCFMSKEFLDEAENLTQMALIATAQLTAAPLSYFISLSFWHFGLHPDHVRLMDSVEPCESDLTV